MLSVKSHSSLGIPLALRELRATMDARRSYTEGEHKDKAAFTRDFCFSSQPPHTIHPSRDSSALLFFGWVQGLGTGSRLLQP